MDPKALAALMAGQAAPAPEAPASTPQPAAPATGGLEVDPELMKYVTAGTQGLMDQMNTTVPEPNAPPEPAPAPGEIPTGSMSEALGRLPGALADSAQEELKPLMAAATGGLKSVFETKDFLFGDTPPPERSGIRAWNDETNADVTKDSLFNGLASGIGQFSVAMMGLGKVGLVAKALPYVGDAITAVVHGAEALKGGTAALEAGMAALAGAVAFDPHENRLSNLIQDTPLANPINAWLAAKPGDSAAWGRVKNAMESLGMDAAVIGSLKVGGVVWKKLKAGDSAGAKRTITNYQTQNGIGQDASQPQGTDGQLQAIPDANAGDNPNALAAGSAVPGNPEAVQNAGIPPQGAADASAVQPTGDVGNTSSTGEAPVVSEPPVDPQAILDEEMAHGAKVDITANPTQVMTEGNLRKPSPFKDQVAYDNADVQAQQPASGVGPSTEPGVVDLMNQSLEQAEKDWDSMDVHGDWSHQADAGHFPRPLDKRFYDSFRTDTDVVNMMDLLTHRKAEELAAKGYRNILTDVKLQRQVKAYASLANMDPAGLMGLLAQGAKDSETAAARMIVTGSLTAKFFQDASLMAMRLKMGDFAEFGSQAAMEAAIAKRFSSAVTLLKMTDQVRANAGRQLRALQGKPFDPSKFEGLTKERFYDLLAQSQGNPDKLKYLADPSLWSKAMDTINYLRIGSLISGPTTQIINIATNGYMVGARPLERILGSLPGAALGSDASKSLVKENLRQYTYMGSALYDGFGQAVKAIMANESQIKPHGSEVQAAGQGPSKWQVAGSQSINGQYFRKWDSIPNLLYNAFSVPMTAAGVPSRLLGGVDELMKQIVYRSKLAARGHTEAVQQAIDAGLKGDAADQFIKSYVKDKLDAGFDAQGRGTDADALKEANIATFQQDLLPGSLGKGVQTLISSDKTKLTRLILPFVKTPTNVLRYGVKMTPGLNMLQQEYRQALFQSTNPELKAQAVGQMTTGALFMGAAAYLGAQGMITGGGPSDPKVKAQLLATGWRPYSIVWKDKDGVATYYPFNRYDPIALPFGIIADIQDAMHVAGEGGEDAPHIASAVGALSMSLAKQITQRTYLLSLKQALDAIQDPGNKGETFFGSMTQSLVPFSAATRQMSTDPYMRDARTIADKMLEAVPGYTSQVPPKMDWLGQPILNRQGLWTDDNGTLVDKEVQRLSMLPEGSVIAAPNPVWNKVDLRDITLKDGTNAYQKYQELAGKPSAKSPSLRSVVANVIRSEAYQRAPDGDLGIKGTKLWLLNRDVFKYRNKASEIIRTDPTVRDALLASQRKVIDHYKHLKEQPPASSVLPEAAGLSASPKGDGIQGIVQGLTSGAQAGNMDQ